MRRGVLSCLLLLLLGTFGQTHSQVPDAVPTQTAAQSLIRQAALKTLNCPSISAQIQHRMDLYGRDLVGSGMYHQARLDRDLLFRTELQVPIAGGIMNLMQICDGRFVWTRIVRPALDGVPVSPPRETRTEAVPIQEVLAGINEQRPREEGSFGTFTPQGVGGLLLQLSRSFQFGEPATTEIKGAPMWLLRGDRIALTDRQSDSLPQSVTLAIGKEDLFPYIVEYRQKVDTEHKKGLRQEVVVQGHERIIMAIEFFDVEFNVPYNPQIYVFRPISQAASLGDPAR
jgi:hypothetical protein